MKFRHQVSSVMRIVFRIESFPPRIHAVRRNLYGPHLMPADMVAKPVGEQGIDDHCPAPPRGIVILAVGPDPVP